MLEQKFFFSFVYLFSFVLVCFVSLDFLVFCFPFCFVLFCFVLFFALFCLRVYMCSAFYQSNQTFSLIIFYVSFS